MTLINELLLLVAAVAIGIGATYIILRRQRLERDARSQESPYGTSTEGEKRCPYCGMFNMWTDRNCISCKRKLPG